MGNADGWSSSRWSVSADGKLDDSQTLLGCSNAAGGRCPMERKHCWGSLTVAGDWRRTSEGSKPCWGLIMFADDWFLTSMTLLLTPMTLLNSTAGGHPCP